MKTKLLLTTIAFIGASFCATAQETNTSEKFGKALNLGIGIGYYGYVDHSIPVFNVNYEFEVLRNFTMAPFLSFYTYSNSHYWGDNNKNYPYRYYSYNETVIPIGVKGSYYFDELLKASSKWDFYAAASLGFAFVSTSWESDYYGDRNAYHGRSRVFLDIHVATEYHLSERFGLFLDLSSGVSTIGLAIH